MSNKTAASSEINDIIARVKGGVPETKADLLKINDPEIFRKWGASLQYSPALIEYEVCACVCVCVCVCDLNQNQFVGEGIYLP